ELRGKRHGAGRPMPWASVFRFPAVTSVWPGGAKRHTIVDLFGVDLRSTYPILSAFRGQLSVDVYLIDGTYELFRHFYAVPPARDREGREVGAVRGVLRSLLGMMTVNTTYIGVATDHVIESFRNQLWSGYKTGDGIDPDLLAQFPLLEDT